MADRPPSDRLRWEPLGRTDPGPVDDSLATAGLSRVRTLVELRRSLPVDAETRAVVRPIPTRAFERGRDEDAWLEANNAAFHWHPEQGGWDRRRLEATLDEPWVDLEGIRVHDGDDGVLDGFCWTKVHPTDPDTGPDGTGRPVGEVWVIAAHPARHGTGLGSSLVLAGMDHLAGRGLPTVSLWTEEDNEPARRMYERLGFSLHQRRGGYA